MNKKTILIITILVLVILAIIAIALLLPNNKKKDSIQANNNAEEMFSLKYKGVEIVPGTEFNEDKIEDEAVLSEIPSCAFEGTDKVYTYDNVELIIAEIDGKDTVYSVYFIDDSAETNEGIKISDTKGDMIEKYGDNYEEVLGNKYVYTKNNVEISFMIENDIITGIEYTLKTSN